MTIRQLLELLEGYSADGRTLDDELLVKIDHELRPITSSYIDGTLVLRAGMPIH